MAPVTENPSPGPVFEAIADAMTVLREHAGNETEADPREARNELREAHMRRKIAKAAKQLPGKIAVVPTTSGPSDWERYWYATPSSPP